MDIKFNPTKPAPTLASTLTTPSEVVVVKPSDPMKGTLADPLEKPKVIEEATWTPDEFDKATEFVAKFASAIQFKNSLRYIQGGTNLTLDRMIDRFDGVLLELYAAGIRRGLTLAEEMLDKQIDH